jgi:hypothetical protein
MRRAAWLLLMVVGGCVDLPEGDVAESDGVQPLSTGCQEDGVCPKNSSVVATYPFHELSVIPGRPNAQGFSVKELRSGATSYKLAVKDGKISGLGANSTISGQALAGTQLWLTRAGREYVIRIRGVVPVTMWAKLDPAVSAPKIEAYRLDWTDVVNGIPIGEWKDVCDQAKLIDGSHELLGAPPDVVFVFEGERIDPRKKIITGIDPTWFNLGCAGHVIAKMYQTGHAGAAAVNGYITTVEQRQTLIKMFTADYCGTGYSFTVPGIDLQWQDDLQWMAYPGPLASLDVEARWKADGPSCLTTPRLKAHPTADSNAVFPDIEQAIADHCVRPKKCLSPDVMALQGHHLITANP